MDFKEKSRNIRSVIVLLAAFITLILNIKYKRTLITSLLILLTIIIIFFIISSIAIRLVEKIMNMERPGDVFAAEQDIEAGNEETSDTMTGEE